MKLGEIPLVIWYPEYESGKRVIIGFGEITTFFNGDNNTQGQFVLTGVCDGPIAEDIIIRNLATALGASQIRDEYHRPAFISSMSAREMLLAISATGVFEATVAA